MELRDAFRYVQEKRDFIRPNNAFFRQLSEFEKNLFKRSTTNIETEQKVTLPDSDPNSVLHRLSSDRQKTNNNKN